ncbi:hypothetical protein C8R44DRAFT_746163 [Mycena epipterygia]|nr:hypothetical protein C8R44DRAFT_746163 [Mycena epipterygia]
MPAALAKDTVHALTTQANTLVSVLRIYCPMSPNPKPLNVAIVGAGLGGLTAAIVLRRQGHLVKVFETSRLDKEIGAAIVVSPNVMCVLEALGYALENLRSSEYIGIVFYDANGGEGQALWSRESDAALILVLKLTVQQQGLSCHRSALHEELKRLALAEEGEGTPVNIYLETKTIDCDPDVRKLTTKTGDEFHVDVVIAADAANSLSQSTV